MTNTDIGHLRKGQVDRARGRLVRKRVKTEAHEGVPTVDYALWPETLALLGSCWSAHPELALASSGGTCLYSSRFEGEAARKKDLISLGWMRAGLSIPLKAFRSISATLLESHPSYGHTSRTSWATRPRASPTGTTPPPPRRCSTRRSPGCAGRSSPPTTGEKGEGRRGNTPRPPPSPPAPPRSGVAAGAAATPSPPPGGRSGRPRARRPPRTPSRRGPGGSRPAWAAPGLAPPVPRREHPPQRFGRLRHGPPPPPPGTSHGRAVTANARPPWRATPPTRHAPPRPRTAPATDASSR